MVKKVVGWIRMMVMMMTVMAITVMMVMLVMMMMAVVEISTKEVVEVIDSEHRAKPMALKNFHENPICLLPL